MRRQRGLLWIFRQLDYFHFAFWAEAIRVCRKWRDSVRTGYYTAEDNLSAVDCEDIGHCEESVVSRYKCVW